MNLKIAFQNNKPAFIALIAVNLFPLFGILFFDWSVVEPVVIYCLEAFMMGFFFIARMLVNSEGSIAEKICFIPFFSAWYFVFVIGEAAFVSASFFTTRHDAPTAFGMQPEEFLDLWPAIQAQLNLYAVGLAVLALFIFHAKSFIKNYIKGDEHKEDMELLVFKPFGRVALLMLIIIPGGLMLYFQKSYMLYAVLLVLIKTVSEIISHYFEHKKTFIKEVTH